MPCAGGPSPAGPPSRSTSRMPADCTWTSRSSKTATSSPRGSRTMSRRSAPRSFGPFRAWRYSGRLGLFGSSAPEVGVGGREFDAVQKNHRLRIHPHEEHDHHRDRSVDAREARHVPDVPGKGLEAPLPQQSGYHRADPDVPKSHLRVRDDVVHEADDEDEKKDRGITNGKATQDRQTGKACQHAGKPGRADHVARADQQKRNQQDQSRYTQHQKREEAVFPEAALPLDAPRMIDGRADRAEEPHRAPDQRQSPRDAECRIADEKGVELPRDEVELLRKGLDTDPENGRPLLWIGRGAPEQREREQEEGKERQERVVRDRCGVTQVVAVVEADEAVPRRQTGQPRDSTDAPADRAKKSPASV